MANRKDYEMLFRLNAQMGGSYSSTFTRAQAEFARLGKEIQSLHRLQGDISSYQKQQKSIGSTEEKLKSLEKQHDLLQKEINETTGSTAGLEREKLKLEQRIKGTEEALAQQKQKLETTGAKLKEAGVDTQNLSQKDAELTAKLKELEAEQERAAEGASSFGEKSAQAFGAIQQAIATAGVAAALKEVAEVYQECIRIAGEFEEAMSTVEALSGASAQEMAELAERAKELGATTKFTAKEASDAMGYMAMAGWDANDMLQGMDGVLQLAAASGEDLAMVSDIVTDSLTAFGLTAADTGHFSDVLAAAATNANTNVSIMGETFKQSAPLAGALGYSIEDVATAVGLMANAGVKGSIAGTSLKNIFNGLLEGVTLTGAAFGEYEFSAIKADGTMKDFGATLDELRGYFAQMTEAEKMSNAETIAGMRGYAGLLSILNATEKDYASLSDSINDCAGAAERMAKIKLDNMNGQLTLMNSAWDALKTTIGEQFIPAMRGVYSIGTDVFTVLNEFVQHHPALIKAVTAFIGIIGVATAGLTAYAAVVKIIKVLDLAALFTGPAGIAVAAIAGIAGLTAAVVGFVSAANEGIPTVKELTEAAQDMRETMETVSDTYEDTADATLAAANIADTYIGKLEALGDSANQSEAEQREYQNTLALLLEVMPSLSDCISQTTDEYGRVTYTLEASTDTLRANTEAWKQNAMAQAYQDRLTALYAAQADVLIEAEKNSIKLTQAKDKLAIAEENRTQAVMRMNQIEQEAYSGNQRAREEYNALSNSLAQYNVEIREAKGTIDHLNDAIRDDEEAVANARAEIELGEEAVRSLTGATQEQTAADAEATAQAQELQSIIEGTTTQISALTESYQKAYAEALESIQGQYALWDEAAAVVETSAGSINSALESQISYWNNYNQNLAFLRERATDIEGLDAVISSFADGSTESVNAIAGISAALRAGNDEDVVAMVANYQALQDAQKDVSQSLADLKTDFSHQMDEIQEDLATHIRNMDLGAEAARSGQATLQGFISAANEMLPQVRTAYANVARAASNELSIKTSAFQRREIKGYASGTTNAPPGWSWVGEEGPELMRMHGGEQILPAGISQEVMENYNAYSRYTTAQAIQSARPALEVMGTASTAEGRPKMDLHFHIEAGASPETVNAWQDYANRGELKATILEVMEEADADTRRRVMG